MKKKFLKLWRLIFPKYIIQQQSVCVKNKNELNSYIAEGWTIKSISAVSYEVGNSIVGYKVDIIIYAVIERRVRK